MPSPEVQSLLHELGIHTKPQKLRYSLNDPDRPPTRHPLLTLYIKRTQRLGLLPVDRTVVGFLGASTLGFLLGARHGGKTEGDRFRAENAHRLPTSQKGWYFYHKSKNYVAMLGGVKEGFRMAGKMSAITVGFLCMESAVDHTRGWKGQMDFVSSVVAGGFVGTLYSAWYRFPAATTIRMGTIGLKIGLVLGLAQDAVGVMRGRKIDYVEFAKKQLGIGRYRLAD